jgi:acyl carrier protein
MEESQLTLEAPIIELALDSLRIIMLVAHIQAKHDCTVTAEDLLELLEARHVGDVVALVRRLTDRPALANNGNA